ncbi:hypothetical protein NP493_3234g00000 [Ridgeia piscesae]|uniref:Uncharacterized protein n=1 Tax=Ridgeia piscesae TaxID=27915 RepID=A0AAD9J8C4_RIDPI|nr:hypothetical protein NP493_3234g00000 [Ridgeia piscesae]
MSVRLSWHTPRSDIPITDYRPCDTLQEVHSFSIESLVGGSKYVVRVQALIITAPKKVISGRVATLHFSTPILTARHIGRWTFVIHR